MHTEIVECSLRNNELLALHFGLRTRVDKRFMSEDEFIETHASGTLRKNKRLKFRYKDQYYHERLAFEFGYPFESLPASRVMFGDPYTEGDTKALTEAGWHIDRYLAMSIFAEDDFRPKYINVEYESGHKKEGVGIIVWTTSAPFVRPGSIVFALVAEFDTIHKKWLPAVNPC